MQGSLGQREGIAKLDFEIGGEGGYNTDQDGFGQVRVDADFELCTPKLGQHDFNVCGFAELGVDAYFSEDLRARVGGG